MIDGCSFALIFGFQAKSRTSLALLCSFSGVHICFWTKFVTDRKRPVSIYIPLMGCSDSPKQPGHCSKGKNASETDSKAFQSKKTLSRTQRDSFFSRPTLGRNLSRSCGRLLDEELTRPAPQNWNPRPHIRRPIAIIPKGTHCSRGNQFLTIKKAARETIHRFGCICGRGNTKLPSNDARKAFVE